MAHRKVQKIGRFLQSGRAVGDHGAGGVRVGGQAFVDAPGQGQPVGRIDFRAAHIDDLLRHDFRQFARFGDAGQHFGDGQLPSLVAVIGEIGARCAEERDGAAGAEYIHAGLAAVRHSNLSFAAASPVPTRPPASFRNPPAIRRP